MVPATTRIKHWLGQYPSLFNGYVKLLNSQTYRHLICEKDTDIVIEGYPRSANTFAVIAFQQAQKEADYPVKIAHHIHVESQLIKAVKNGIPAWCVIRHPEDCVMSYLIRRPDLTADWALKLYIQFHKNLLPYKDKIFFSDFPMTTTRLDEVITGINAKFDSDFKPFIHTDENTETVFNSINEVNQKLFNGLETHVARPSTERKNTPHKVKLPDKLLTEAVSLYESFRNIT